MVNLLVNQTIYLRNDVNQTKILRVHHRKVLNQLHHQRFQSQKMYNFGTTLLESLMICLQVEVHTIPNENEVIVQHHRFSRRHRRRRDRIVIEIPVNDENIHHRQVMSK